MYVQRPLNLKVVKYELNISPPRAQIPKYVKTAKDIKIPKVKYRRKESYVPPAPPVNGGSRKRDVRELVEELIQDLYSNPEWKSSGGEDYTQRSESAASLASQSTTRDFTYAIERAYLESLDISELREQLSQGTEHLKANGDRLARLVRARDRLRRHQRRLCAALTLLLRHITGESGAQFGVRPGGEAGAEGAGEGGYAEWLHAMRLVARLPAGVPQHFRRKLWLTLAERHLAARGGDWPAAERACFRGAAQPDDTELGAQILKDLHRTGCSLFCGAEGRENQAMLRRVLLAYARWNKEVGYCQGFNMIAAIILEVMEKSESDSLKVMIYLVEAVLPEGYFADDLRGLSADMAAFRDLLRLRLPRLAHHMDQLQRASDGGGVEPPLPDVFTMQWFLTLYATWLPRESLLRIWDLVLLDGNEILLLTALAIWDLLQDRILSARSADEYYSCMGGGVRAVWEAGEALVARVVALGSVPELPRLRSLHRYRVAPPAPPAPPTQAPIYQPPIHSAMQTMTKKGLRLFYSEDEGDSSDDGNKLALATMIPRRDNRQGAGDRLSLDIGALKRQYARLRERQRQAHVILAAACARHAAVGVPTSPTSLTVNNLLLGKSAIVSSRGRRLGPPPGSVPPTRQIDKQLKSELRSLEKRDDTISWKEEQNLKSMSRRNSVKWKDIKKEKAAELTRKASIDFDEMGDGIIVSEREANEMIAGVRSRSSSASSSYSSHSSASSTDTSLCDENERVSESESELHVDEVKRRSNIENSANRVKIENRLCDEKNTTISDFIDSAAGEPLRTYIDAFQAKASESLHSDHREIYKYKPKSPFKDTDFLFQTNPSDNSGLDKKSELLLRLSQTRIDQIPTDYGHIASVSKPRTPKNFTELSPIDISPCDFGHEKMLLPLDTDFKSPLNPRSLELQPRPPDIIDSLTMYPNFVPDIDLSEKNTSDIDSAPQSPGAESIVVSEDEPPIPLKIDKYFEYSPDFFGARITVTDSNNPDIPSRRATKRQSRFPKKPDSLTLQSTYSENNTGKTEGDRASSLPHSTSNNFETESIYLKTEIETQFKNKDDSRIQEISKQKDRDSSLEFRKHISPIVFADHSGRKNSERALQIIQENSKILSRILTKQNILETTKIGEKTINESSRFQSDSEKFSDKTKDKYLDSRIIDSPLLKESTSDSLIGYCKRQGTNENLAEKTEFTRIRPISLDDPFSFSKESILPSPRSISNEKTKEFLTKTIKSPSSVCLENKTDTYGWENKGFMAKCDLKCNFERTEPSLDYNTENKSRFLNTPDRSSTESKQPYISDWSKNKEYLSVERRSSVTFPSSEIKDTAPYVRRITSDDYSYLLSSKYNDFVLSKASDICSETVDRGPKVCENVSKMDSSQASDFAHVVTSSISFTYEPSVEDDSLTGAKSNSSDTLCQITSLDQVSTPISPKIFPTRETPTLPKESLEKSERTKYDSEDTCSAITSLIETDTLSSLSYPRSPSTGSYHPFPARPAIRMPKELGIRLGMYPRDSLNSPSK